ncbi:MAG TPA: hypothetical protein PKE04_08095 [Clostridia bacterium]|nr:hypothetical protein [Clostridia bacterium]
MYGTGLKKLGEEWSMKPMDGMLCGIMQGFPVAMSEGMGYKQLTINLCMLKPDAPDAEPDLAQLLTQPAQHYRITEYEADGPYLTVQFFDNPGTMRKIREYVNVEMPRLRQAGFAGADCCFQCNAPIGEEDSTLYAYNGIPLRLHARCVDDMKAVFESETREQEDAAMWQSSNPLAFVGALLGGLVGCIPWVVIYVFGYMASLAAALIALGANYGHRLFGGREGKGRFALVVALTLLLTPVTNALGVAAQFGYGIHTGELQEAWEIPKDSLSLEDTLPLFFEMIKDPEVGPEFMSSFIRELGTAYLFAALGLWMVWKKLRKENARGKRRLAKVA